MRSYSTLTRSVTALGIVAGLSAGSSTTAKADEASPLPPSGGQLPAPAPQPAGPPIYAPQPNYWPPPPAYAPMEHASHHGLSSDARYRSPGLAVALSLQPLPVDFGNLYAENLGWGIAYTAIEVSLMAPMMWMTGQHMDHGYGDERSWSSGERTAMAGFVAGYVAVKLVAGLHAGYAAQSFNRAGEPRGVAFVAPARGGAAFMWSRAF